jgi:hypothetical protein
MQEETMRAALLAAMAREPGYLPVLALTAVEMPRGAHRAPHPLVLKARRAVAEAARHPLRTGRRYLVAQWRALPGPVWVKALLIGLAVAEIGPFGELALIAFTTIRSALRARKTARQRAQVARAPGM